ncbi:hypothetical protein ANCDUO_00512 [Ancylostoma duodenale]|uniref:Uncharacterized protein n=1 Tax=Ancylostoma duodenale TaxID=51022 RepID=A0A0C2HHN8_9BILA|nr:hypothetical protein ANCDUO_00512 [Ancylostoma duodenale]
MEYGSDVTQREDLTDYVSYKVAAAVLGHDSRWERFMLSKYVAIQLTEDFFAPEHSLVMPDNITQSLSRQTENYERQSSIDVYNLYAQRRFLCLFERGKEKIVVV